jgi:hypothetical protein
MALFYSSESANIAALPVIKQANAGYAARLQRFRGTFVFSNPAVTTADQIIVAQVPAGFTFAYGILVSTVSLGTSTVAIGTAASTGKYRAAATFTAVDTPTLFGVATQVGAQAALSADELIQIAVGVASLPTSGTLVTDLYFSRQ